MPIPPVTLTPPFNVVRCAYIDFNVTDLDASQAFYDTTLGLTTTARDTGAIYLRALEERNHHSFEYLNPLLVSFFDLDMYSNRISHLHGRKIIAQLARIQFFNYIHIFSPLHQK